MRIDIQLDPGQKEPRVIILTDRVTPEITALAARLQVAPPQAVVGFFQERAELLPPGEVTRIYGENGKVYARARGNIYTLRARLYEMEERLTGEGFVRISGGELVNLRRIKSLDLNLSGTICLKLDDGDTTFVSRRYVGKIKQTLGL